MKIMDKYLLGEMVVPLICGVLGFITILLGDRLYHYIRIILEKRASVADVVAFLIFNLPSVVVLAVAVSTALACCLAVSRLNYENELAVIRMAGVSTIRLFLSLLLCGLVMMGLAFAINEKVVPWGEEISQQALRRILFKQPTLLPKEGTFIKGGNDWYFRVERRDPKTDTLHQILVYQLRPRGLPILWTAKSAVLRDNRWRFEQVKVFKFSRGGDMIEVEAGEMNLDLNKMIQTIAGGSYSSGQMSLRELREEIQKRKRARLPTYRQEIELQLRFAIPAACFLFVLVACPLCLHFRAGGELQGVLLTIGLVFCYYLMYLLCKTIGLEGKLPPILSAWTPNFLFLTAGLYLLWKKR